MLAIVNPIPGQARDIFNNAPEERQRVILERLQKKGITTLNNYTMKINDLVDIKVLDVDYLHFLTNAYQSAHDSGDHEWYSNDRLIPAYFSRSKPNSNVPLYKHSGWYCNDMMTPITSQTFKSVIESATNCLLAAEILATEGGSKTNLIYCINSSPGHHATSRSYGGYCFLNNAAVAAKKLQQLRPCKVAILDLDFHAGDGTAAMFSNDDSILPISLHADPAKEYPSFSCYEDDNNIIVPSGASGSVYQKCLELALQRIRMFAPQYLVIAFGADTFKDDPDPAPENRFALEIPDYFEMASLIRGLNLPTIVTQEGGYYLKAVPDIVWNFLRGLGAS